MASKWTKWSSIVDFRLITCLRTEREDRAGELNHVPSCQKLDALYDLTGLHLVSSPVVHSFEFWLS